MNEMKELLLEILENVFKSPDVTATQQMGVQLNNSMKRDGVVIIQNQNVEVLSHIVPLITKGIRLCESFNPVTQIAYSPIEIIKEETEGNPTKAKTPVVDYCQSLFELNTNWEDMQTFTKDAYIEYVLSKFKTKAEAARFLGIGPTYLCKLTKEV